MCVYKLNTKEKRDLVKKVHKNILVKKLKPKKYNTRGNKFRALSRATVAKGT